MKFEPPESYRAYCSDVAVRTAVDHILSADSKKPLALPADIEWKDLPAFHRAVLSAHQVRCEFAVSLIELWDAVWQRALDGWDQASNLATLTIADTQTWHSTALDTKTTWDERWFGRVFDIGGTDLQLALDVRVDAEELRLLLCLWGKDDMDHTTGLDLGDGWPEQDIEDGVAWTRKDLAQIRDDGMIDLDPVRKAAEDAVAAVAVGARG